MKEKTPAQKLFDKYIAGECTPEEVADLMAYTDDPNVTFEIRNAIRGELNFECAPDKETQEKVARFSNKVGKKLMRNIRKKHSLWPYVAAASVIIGFGLALYFGMPQSTIEPTTPNAYINDVPPGGNKATLLLENGQSIVLSPEKELIVIDEDQVSYEDGVLISGFMSTTMVTNHTITVPAGGQYSVLLSDGTKVWLNAASSLSYPSRFTGAERRVVLSGEAYFEVADNPEAPFIVAAQNQEVRVLGTHFNINAYPNEPLVKTTLVEGSVIVRSLDSWKEVVLKPGEQAILDHQAAIRKTQADPNLALAWKSGKFIFHGQDLASIMRQVARWYDVDIQFEKKAPLHLKFGGTISRNNNLSSVLMAMEKTGNIRFDIEGKTVVVRNKR